MDGISVLLIEDVEAEVCCVRWRVQVQRDGDVGGGRVGDLVEADLIVDVGYFVAVVDGLFDEAGTTAGEWGGGVEGLFKGAFEDFHHAVSVGVVVDWTAFSRVWEIEVR